MSVEPAASPVVFYRPPVGATPVLIRTDRKGRQSRFHMGARVGGGPLLMPEACNLDQAVRIIDLGDVPLPIEARTDGSACRRCFPA